jgi:hypothetical protein
MLGRPSRRTRKELEDHGRSATATVVEIAKHGLNMSSGNETTWTNEIALKTRLRVEPQGDPTFEWKGRLRFRESHTPAASDRVWVLFDPDDHRSLMVDFSVREGAWDGVSSAEAGAGADGEAFLATIIDASRGSAGPAPRDPLDQLEKLADLRDRGVLTSDEFEAQKRRLLGDPPA